MTQRNQKQGATLESFILQSPHVRLVKIPTPLQILGPAPAPRTGKPRAGIMLARLEPPVCVDFVGCATGEGARGRAVYLEAKSADGGAHPASFSLDDRLAGHQGVRLHEAALDGAIAAVFVRRLAGEAGTLLRPRWIEAADYLIPWPEGDPALWMEPRKSWPWGALEERAWRVPPLRRWTEALGFWEAYRLAGWRAE